MSRWEISQPVKGKQEWTYYVYNVFLLYVYTYIIITLFTKLTTEFIIRYYYTNISNYIKFTIIIS